MRNIKEEYGGGYYYEFGFAFRSKLEELDD